MVKVRLLPAVVLIATTLAGAAGAGEPHPQHRLPPVAEVEVLHNGARSEAISSDLKPAACADFALAPDDVRAYFRQARRTTERQFTHDLEMSPCHAHGRLVLADGQRGDWFIDRERRGRLGLGDGRTLFFHCPACRAPAFDPP
ncbi:hypothetical protein OOT46_10225 [Aquabacterium sp. A7-Y]|uniref:hypothetical protein n=1 Tax=Aquabacterium sp. A7-Y TaxID=1349605 RepID=UPI00223E5DBE|nr:hypothetical protein [Aquabacterium sp. A7-Y]MCW7538223.1 hypothetical protein [Aquabacterium sp. A7-Y]